MNKSTVPLYNEMSRVWSVFAANELWPLLRLEHSAMPLQTPLNATFHAPAWLGSLCVAGPPVLVGVQYLWCGHEHTSTKLGPEKMLLEHHQARTTQSRGQKLVCEAPSSRY